MTHQDRRYWNTLTNAGFRHSSWHQLIFVLTVLYTALQQHCEFYWWQWWQAGKVTWGQRLSRGQAFLLLWKLHTALTLWPCLCCCQFFSKWSTFLHAFWNCSNCTNNLYQCMWVECIFFQKLNCELFTKICI